MKNVNLNKELKRRKNATKCRQNKGNPMKYY